MKNFWQNNNNLKKILLLILAWWIFAAAIVSLTVHYFSFTPTFPYYFQDIAPYYGRFLGFFAHFDGIHYLRIAASGHYPAGGEVAFFPFYPILIHGLLNLGIDKLWASLIISNFCLVLSLLILSEIYPRSSSKLTLILLTFPTSFFFMVAYTESLYLLLFSLMLFFVKRSHYLLAAIMIALSTATRFVGIAMIPYLVISAWGKTSFKKLLFLTSLTTMGIVSYMGYLWQTKGDPLAFIHVQPTFGMGRSGGQIIYLPQVLFRYGKMLFLTNPNSLVYWRALAEIGLFIIIIYVLCKVWHRLSLAELIYTLTVLLIPTFSGTLSSYPRYALAAIPLFATVSSLLSTKQVLCIAAIQICLLAGSIVLYTQGLFIA